MQNEFVKYEQALALKELSFNEPCLASYDYAGEFKNPFDYNSEEQDGYVTNESLTNPDNFNASSNPLLLKMYVGNPFVAAPLYQQAFRWFREKHNLQHHIWSGKLNHVFYGYDILNIQEQEYVINNSELGGGDCDYNTYEEAQDACLKNLIEIVKQKQ